VALEGLLEKKLIERKAEERLHLLCIALLIE
jgi:hypothetical protein